jgi:hypothetical protein
MDDASRRTLLTATAVHVIQNKLLSRPTSRKYLENAEAAGGK